MIILNSAANGEKKQNTEVVKALLHISNLKELIQELNQKQLDLLKISLNMETTTRINMRRLPDNPNLKFFQVLIQGDTKWQTWQIVGNTIERVRSVSK